MEVESRFGAPRTRSTTSKPARTLVRSTKRTTTAAAAETFLVQDGVAKAVNVGEKKQQIAQIVDSEVAKMDDVLLDPRALPREIEDVTYPSAVDI